mmetsp:Transcript_34452/g.97623  ORF Transcript_34452/g.97623 Transcript_34452/m.97623 type:complete len:391 (-) Transcript_34452:18-1190(-)
MGRKRQEQKEALLNWLAAAACVLYLLVVLKWIAESRGHRLTSHSYRRSGSDVSADFDYAEYFWKEHYNQAASVPWSLVEEDFIISTASPHSNITHSGTAILAPFVDGNGDGFVTKDELAEFLSKFGGKISQSEGHLAATIHKAMAHAEAMHGSTSDGDSDPHGCAVHFKREKKQYMEIVNSGGLQFPGSQPFTIEAWVRPQRRNKDMVIVSKYNRGKWGQYMVKVDELGHVFFHREVAPWGQKSLVKLPVGDFSHVAAVYDGKMSRIFVNGTLSKEQKEGAQDNNPETPVLIGAMQENGTPTEFFDGSIDEVRLWDVARSEVELHHFMHVSLSGSEDGLVGLWNLDECAGMKAKDRLGKHDAVLRGASWERSSLNMKTYQESFGCIDSLC